MANQNGKGSGPAELTASDVLAMVTDAHKAVRVNAAYLVDILANELAQPANISAAEWSNKLIGLLIKRLDSIADILHHTAASRSQGKIEAEPAEKLDDAGQGAVNTLRSILPTKIEAIRTDIERGPNTLLLGGYPDFDVKGWRTRRTWEMDRFKVMLATLHDFVPKNPKHRASHWRREVNSPQHHAWEFYTAFRELVGNASTAKNGPAVRFVQAALAHTGVRMQAGAIEQALRRSARNYKSRGG